LNLKTHRDGGTAILFDGDVLDAPTADLFAPEWWRERDGVVGTAQGRGSVLFVRHGSRHWALRRFRRGGWPARVNADRYLWLGLERTRPWREMRLLAELGRRGFPVPVPVAACVQRSALLYRGALLTTCIESVDTLAGFIKSRPLPEDDWGRIGALLGELHRIGVHHEDINVSNVLRDAAGRFYLIDFDKARFAGAGAWRERNLARFRRSLDKLSRRVPGVHFTERDWTALRAGYRAVSEDVAPNPAGNEPVA
jgi:3-deoxy-D-manno-octulosonic acid kinase